MSKLFPNTSSEAEAMFIGLLRGAPPWRKLEMMNRLNASMHTLLLSGVKQRYRVDYLLPMAAELDVTDLLVRAIQESGMNTGRPTTE